MADLLEIFEYSQDGSGGQSLAIDAKTKELYWNGEKLITEKRWGTVERRLAISGLVIALLGVLATVVQAWAAVFVQQAPPISSFQLCLERFDEMAGERSFEALGVCKDYL